MTEHPRKLDHTELRDLEELVDTPSSEYRFDNWETTFIDSIYKLRKSELSPAQIVQFKKLRDKVWDS